MLVVAMVPVLAGLVIAAVGVLGLRERLPRNRFFGVRTQATLRTEETFRLANKVAGMPTIVGGLVGVLAGIAAALMPSTGGLVACVVIGLVGTVAVTVGAGALGHRAALTVADADAEPATPAGCGGCACGDCTILTSGSR